MVMFRVDVDIEVSIMNCLFKWFVNVSAVFVLPGSVFVKNC